MKFNKNLLKEKWFSYTVAMCSAVVLYLILTHISGLLNLLKSFWHTGAPVFMGFVIAYVLDPLVNLYSKKVLYKVKKTKLRHTLAVTLSILSVVLFIVILVVALVPQVIDSTITFAGNLNGYVLSFQRLMRRLNTLALQHDIDLSKFISSSDELLQSITKILPDNLNKILNVSYNFGARMFDWVISFILAIYLMLDKTKLRGGFKRLLRAMMPENVYNSTASFWSRCNKILIQYIAFDVMDGVIIGLLNWFFMVVMQMPYVAIISVIVGVTNLAPTFGPMVGAIIGAFILLLVDPMYALIFLIFTAVLQTLDGYVIKPRLFGESLGVSSEWILISLVVGGRLLGVVGILLAIPFAAIGDFVYHDYIIKRLEAQRAEKQQLKDAAAAGKKAALQNMTTLVDVAESAVMEVEKAAAAADAAAAVAGVGGAAGAADAASVSGASGAAGASDAAGASGAGGAGGVAGEGGASSASAAAGAGGVASASGTVGAVGASGAAGSAGATGASNAASFSNTASVAEAGGDKADAGGSESGEAGTGASGVADVAGDAEVNGTKADFGGAISVVSDVVKAVVSAISDGADKAGNMEIMPEKAADKAEGEGGKSI